MVTVGKSYGRARPRGAQRALRGLMQEAYGQRRLPDLEGAQRTSGRDPPLPLEFHRSFGYLEDASITLSFSMLPANLSDYTSSGCTLSLLSLLAHLRMSAHRLPQNHFVYLPLLHL